jgi:nucleotide-binding universal stress UspA family protein
MSNSASTIKRILVPLDLSEYAEAATQRACALAKSNQATVTGMVVLDTPEITGSGVPSHPCNLLDYTKERISERTREAEQAIHDALAKFAYECNEAGVPHSEAEFQGVPGDQIVEASHYFDLLVMGLRTYFHFETQRGSGDSLEKVLDHSPTPVLTLPKLAKQPLCSILIAFDGSLPAVRALHTFAQTTWPEKVDITILMSHKDPDYRSMALAEASAYLRSHGYDAIHTVGTDQDIGTVIDHDYIEKTDLVVAGMHAKKRIKDFFVGSLTKQLIDYGHTALLLA